MKTTPFRVHYDVGTHTIKVQSKDGTPAEGAFTVSPAADGSMKMQSKLDGNLFNLQLLPVDYKLMTLLSRGFHWVSEKSFYR
jgi:hypothetical protein